MKRTTLRLFSILIALVTAFVFLSTVSEETICEEPYFENCFHTYPDKNPNVPSDCYLILGDSRSAALITIMLHNKEYELLYYYKEDPACDAVFRRNNSYIVVCAEGGGRYANGALDRTYNRLKRLIATNEKIQNSPKYIAYNMFGINDLNPEGMSSMKRPPLYVKKDTAIRKELGEKCVAFMQFTAGPVNEDGWLCVGGYLKNSDIKLFNSKFKGNTYVQIVDLFAYLEDKGYATAIDGDGDSGLHYDNPTNEKILNLVIELGKGA